MLLGWIYLNAFSAKYLRRRHDHPALFLEKLSSWECCYDILKHSLCRKLTRFWIWAHVTKYVCKVSRKNAFTMHMFKDMDVVPNCCRKSRNIWKEIIRTLAKRYLNLSIYDPFIFFFKPFFLFLVTCSLTKKTFLAILCTVLYKDTHSLPLSKTRWV